MIGLLKKCQLCTSGNLSSPLEPTTNMHLGAASQMLLTEVKLSLRCTLGNPAIHDLWGNSTLYTKQLYHTNFNTAVLFYIILTNHLSCHLELSSTRQSYFYYEYVKSMSMSNSFENSIFLNSVCLFSSCLQASLILCLVSAKLLYTKIM